VARPLARIASDATRLGHGDFRPIAPVEGPAEVAELADDLERMRHALAALDSLKEGFVASVSHELRTPLAKIREALALLDDGAAGELNARQSSLVAIARRACESQIQLVTNLLDLSRLRAGSVVKMHAEGALEDVVREAVTAETEDAASRKVTLELVAESGPSVRAMDATLLERAVANLVRNAAQASPSGGVVRVRTTVLDRAPSEIAARAAAGSQWLQVSVEDDGPGVPEEARAALFQPFNTAPSGVGVRKVGVGLGLALAREVARAHGGDAVHVERGDAQRGARFELWIPFAPGATDVGSP
jgi:two-component system sensor histidine kinase GlrK